MTKITSFLTPYKIAIIIALFLMLTELAVELVQPLIISYIIDQGILQNDLSAVIMWGAVLIGCSIAAFAAGVTNSFYSSHVSQSFGFDIREALYKKVQDFSFSNFSVFPTSSLITRLTNDVTMLQNTVFMSLRIMMRAPLLVIGSVIMALLVNPMLALVLVISVPVLILFLVVIMSKAGNLFKSVQERLDHVNNVMQENLIGIRLIKAFLRGKHEMKRFRQSSEQLMDKTVSALRLIEVTMPVILLLMNISILVILWYGSVEVNTGGASVGEVVAIVNYATRMTGALSIVTMIIMVFSRAKASSARIGDVLNTDIDLYDQASSKNFTIKKGEVSFEHVSFTYPETSMKVLDDLSFTIKAGERVSVLGGTGSGKSTIFQLIPRLYDVNEGTVRIDGQPISDMTLKNLRNQIGFVPQEAMLFTGTIQENIKWGNEHATFEEVQEAARQAQIHDTIMSLPKQYDTILGQKGVNLSGGQKQRLSIARALVKKPVILLLDDSTSALDMKTEARLLKALEDLKCTTIMITQKISTTMASDRILLIEDGKLLESGHHDELVKTSGLYRKIVESQAGKEALPYAE
ncbi:ABC transporter ATP-binding protein [Jeotgalibacillus haloalkalitolerans]|uniref:ABC transporter ATP-binding protein n=1 Tax=Jeotgalibacillus haloalkalitolerans TaxID=3104292 RepID=A0ABU5KQA6_9BACL|nr:ABC transporter ATP-binding protein [Jeotgalibacillus sp. HH7-29]MDZ5713439.1 ABC transporter ATP-binding protein [Jeotgalibacillus sp. HH7-29]